MMEYEMSWPGRQPWWPKYGPQSYADCKPTGDAIGGGAALPCESGLNCGVWVFSCAHRITKFGVVQNHGWIQEVDYFPNDTVRVTVCWDDSARGDGQTVGPQAFYATSERQSVVSIKELKCIGPGATCKDCIDCKTKGANPVITYTTQQMSCTGGGSTQALSATGGGGGPYKWTSGGKGSFSPTQTGPGQSTTYTAPTTNASCLNNPTIQVTDYCSGSATLQIAVNCYSGGANDEAFKKVVHTGSSCTWAVSINAHRCDNTQKNTFGCDSCDCQITCGGTGDTCCCLPCVGESCTGFRCTYATLVARCTVNASCGAGITCVDHTIDSRTPTMIVNGCCPASLL
jgi:hypothetical protein